MSFTEILNRIEYLIHLIEMMIKLYHEANEEQSDEDTTVVADCSRGSERDGGGG